MSTELITVDYHTKTDIVISCSCPTCLIKPILEHQHVIIINELIPWVSGKLAKRRELEDKARAYGLTVEQVMKKEAEGKL